MENKIRKLYRSQTNKVIDGVCGGLAEYFQIDPVLVRIIFFALIFFHGLGIILYIILLFAVPKNPEKPEDGGKKDFFEKAGDRVQTLAEEIKEDGKCCVGRKNTMIGLLVVIIGLLFFVDQFFPVRWFTWKLFLSALLIALGLFFILKGNKKTNGK